MMGKMLDIIDLIVLKNKQKGLVVIVKNVIGLVLLFNFTIVFSTIEYSYGLNCFSYAMSLDT